MSEPAAAAHADGGSRQEQPAAAAATAATAAAAAADPVFTVLSERVVHQRYLTLYNRAVQFPSSDGVAEVRACRPLPLHRRKQWHAPPADCHWVTVAAACLPACPAGPRARV